MVQTRMVQTRNKLKFDIELDKLKELISERRSNKKIKIIKIKQKQETENKRKLRLVKKKRSKEGVSVWKKTSK